ncbi:DUF58 domain-containing protein [Frankia sp. CNm7]|uniref:DUF58 domain-containing protein n=1 Tax=Frankia nepalensis TaxID=1836974 RepID=A0A937RVP4_9ACTN|nr:DUF58 domain-containing protein [Frankia nepalensis]MBL7501609.1 DUF58 domain-containing protein [Frankia nepalensis]MBL7513384.1 DUF58 domain-containing protein [Frankia nepalensis]MBL7521057.1 DUF58 domain-containing protein [Frankia nepalensis]MBL7633698.1 DUF58 domain-containing protein [Frankia nepalensis]
MRDFAAALRGLTVRGRSFLAAGAACAVCAVVLGEQDLLRVALLLLLLPLLAAAFVSRTRYRLACTRRVDPPRVSAGQAARVRIQLANMSRLPSSVLLVEDAVPEELGVQARFVLDRIEPGGTRDMSYELGAAHRGRYQLGPMSIRLSDPFGFCELARAFRGRDELVVTPAIETLPGSRSERHVAASALRRAALHGEDEPTTRPYRSGDDLRRVHWRTSARTGELMVRREDAPRLSGATILLDDHVGSWGHQAGPDSPFEWAVSVAGSIGAHLALAGYSVRLVTHRGLAAAVPPGRPGPLLDELAMITQTPVPDPRAAYGAISAGDGGMLVLVLGRTSPEVARRLAAIRPRGAPAIAVLADLTHWYADQESPSDLAGCELALRRAGWRVLVSGRGGRLAEEWPRLARPVTRFGGAASAAKASPVPRPGEDALPRVPR